MRTPSYCNIITDESSEDSWISKLQTTANKYTMGGQLLSMSVLLMENSFGHEKIHRPSIHPLLSFMIQRWGHDGSRLARVFQTSLTPATPYSSSWGSWGVPRPDGISNPVTSGSSPLSPPSLFCLPNIQREAPTRHPNQIPECLLLLQGRPFTDIPT